MYVIYKREKEGELARSEKRVGNIKERNAVPLVTSHYDYATSVIRVTVITYRAREKKSPTIMISNNNQRQILDNGVVKTQLTLSIAEKR